MVFAEHGFAINKRHRARRASVALGLTAAVCASVTVAASAVAATASPARHTPAGHARSAKAAPATVPTGPFSVNNTNREDVRQFYNQIYAASNGVAEGWTGNISSCTPGNVSPAFLASVLTRINYYRTMAGVPDVTFNGTDAGTSSDPNNAEAQAAALMESANNFLQHTPPQAGTNCWTQQSFNGSSSSNLFETDSTAPGATGGPGIDNLMADEGPLGHRRNMLDPVLTEMGAGAVPATPGFQGSLAQLVLTNNTTPTGTTPIEWPPGGTSAAPDYVPYEVVDPIWSFSLPNANFANATVSMTLNGNSIPVAINCFDPTTSPTCGGGTVYGGGEPAISFIPNNVPVGSTWPKPAEDDTYKVTINNISGVTQTSYTYSVIIFDPAVPGTTDTISSAPSGPATVTTGSNNTYNVSPVSDPLVNGYEWRTTPLSPENVSNDPATDGGSNWTASVSPTYPVISTSEPTGATAFRLSSQGTFNPLAAPAQQTLTLNQTIFPSAGAQLSFGSLFFDLGFSTTPSETASVDVSTDGGSTWTSVFSQSPSGTEQDSSFTPETVNLDRFANEQIELRFSLTHTSGEWGDCCAEPNGWYFDDVTLSGVQAAGTPTPSSVQSDSFNFNPSQAGQVAIDVAPQFSDPNFGSPALLNWSPALVVTVNPPSGSTTSLASSPNPSTGGQQVTYTATVSGGTGTTTPTGSVTFTDNSATLCSSVSLSAGQATCQQTYSTGGTHSIVATYGGGGGFSGSTSPALTQTVNAIARSSVSLVSSASSVTEGQQVTLTATVTPTDSGGTVNFQALEDSTAGCTNVPLNAAGQATCVTSFSNPRVESDVTADYSGDANFTGEESNDIQIDVAAPTSTSVSSSSNPSNPGDSVTYTATVNGDTFLEGANGEDSVAFIDLTQGTTIPGCAEQVPHTTGTPHQLQATCTAPAYTTAGAHAIVAEYSGYKLTDDIAGSASPALSQFVGTPASTSTSLTPSANPATTGQQVTYTATVTGFDGSGTVTFTDLGFPISGCQELTLTGGQATCSQTYADTSSHSIAAVYGGDAGSAASSSNATTETVNLPPAPVQNAAVANLGNGVAQVNFGTTAGPRTTGTSGGASAVTGYNVYEGTAPGKESKTPVNKSRVLATAKGFTVKGLTTGKKYYFVVRALNPKGLGAPSKEVSTTEVTAPGAPQSLSAHAGRESVALKWTAPSSSGGSAVTGYSVYEGTYSKGESPEPVTAKPLSGSARSYTVKGLIDGTKYYFVVRAQNAAAVGTASNEASATPATVPAAPTSLTATAGKTSAVLKWAVVWNDSGSAVMGYDVYKGTSPGHESTTPVNAKPLSQATRTYTVTGLTNGTKYYFIVKAINAVGTSAASNEASAKPLA